MFIGSSGETLSIATALERELQGDLEIEVWDKAFSPGHYTLEDLKAKAASVSFAAFIIGQDDLTESRGELKLSPRDNVIYEAGLFAGHIGIENVFLLVDDQGVKIPTDWLGLSYIKYTTKQDYKAAGIESAAQKIRKALLVWKEKFKNDFRNRIIDNWWQCVINRDDDSILSLMDISRQNDTVKIYGRSWTSTGIPIAKYQSKALALDKDARKIFYYWEGEHPHGEKASRFFGCGEIDFSENSVNGEWEADGWYSESPLSDLDASKRKSAIYKRAKDHHVKIVKSGGDQHRKELIAALLKERDDEIGSRNPNRSQ